MKGPLVRRAGSCGPFHDRDGAEETHTLRTNRSGAKSASLEPRVPLGALASDFRRGSRFAAPIRATRGERYSSYARSVISVVYISTPRGSISTKIFLGFSGVAGS